MYNDEQDTRQTTHIAHQAPYDPYGNRDEGQAPRKKKGIAGIVVACTLSAALIGGIVGGIGGVTVGYNMAPAQAASTAQPQAAANLSQEPTAAPIVVPATNAGTAMTIAQIAEKVMPSVVAIDATISTQTMTPFGIYEQEGDGSGSGVIISSDGYIVTNQHVIEDARAAKVHLSDGTTYDASLVGLDEEADIAVLKIEAENLTPIAIGSSGALRVGDIAIAVGNPLGKLANSVTQGIVSALEREMEIEGVTMNLMQVDAAINQGNSGGALVNGSGELVGIVNAKSVALGVEGIGFAIPIDDVKDMIDDFVKTGAVKSTTPKLGVTTRNITEEISRQYGYPVGAYVISVEEFSAAERAGLRAGDVILSLANEEVKTNDDLLAIRDQYAIGDTLDMVVDRNGEEISLKITLMEQKTGF